MLVIAAILISLIATGGVLARWTGIASPAQKDKAKSGAEIAPESFTNTSPAKEYFYAGGKLVATEEPTTTLSR